MFTGWSWIHENWNIAAGKMTHTTFVIIVLLVNWDFPFLSWITMFSKTSVRQEKKTETRIRMSTNNDIPFSTLHQKMNSKNSLRLQPSCTKILLFVCFLNQQQPNAICTRTDATIWESATRSWTKSNESLIFVLI